MTEFRSVAAHLTPEVYSHLKLAVSEVDLELYAQSSTFLDHVDNSAS